MSITRQTDVYKFSPYTGASFLVHIGVADSVPDDAHGLFFMSLHNLAAKLRMHPSSVRRIIRQMEEDGWLTRLPDTKQVPGAPTYYRYQNPGGYPQVWGKIDGESGPNGKEVYATNQTRRRPGYDPSTNVNQFNPRATSAGVEPDRGDQTPALVARPPRATSAPRSRQLRDRTEPEQKQNENPPGSVPEDAQAVDAPAASPAPTEQADQLFNGPDVAQKRRGNEPGPNRAQADEITRRYWDWFKANRNGRTPVNAEGRRGNPFAAIRGIFETLLDSGWTEREVVLAAAAVPEHISFATMSIALGRQREQAARAEAPARRDAWMGSVSAGEVEAREAQEAFHRARLAATGGQPPDTTAPTPQAARAGRLRDPLRDRQPAPPTAPDPAA